MRAKLTLRGTSRAFRWALINAWRVSVLWTHPTMPTFTDSGTTGYRVMLNEVWPIPMPAPREPSECEPPSSMSDDVAVWYFASSSLTRPTR